MRTGRHCFQFADLFFKFFADSLRKILFLHLFAVEIRFGLLSAVQLGFHRLQFLTKNKIPLVFIHGFLDLRGDPAVRLDDFHFILNQIQDKNRSVFGITRFKYSLTVLLLCNALPCDRVHKLGKPLCVENGIALILCQPVLFGSHFQKTFRQPPSQRLLRCRIGLAFEQFLDLRLKIGLDPGENIDMTAGNARYQKMNGFALNAENLTDPADRAVLLQIVLRDLRPFCVALHAQKSKRIVFKRFLHGLERFRSPNIAMHDLTGQNVHPAQRYDRQHFCLNGTFPGFLCFFGFGQKDILFHFKKLLFH